MSWLTFVLLFQATPSGDVVVLKNGDTVSGTLQTMVGGVLTITTEYSKEVKITADKIRGITTAKSVTVELVDGEILKGKLAPGAEGQIVVVSDIAGKTVAIDMAKVKAINPPETPPARLRGSVSLGGLISTGNTERKALTFAAEAERRTEDDRLGFRFLWNYAEEQEENTARNVFVSAKYDYFFIKKKLYAYVTGDLYNDKFKDLELRATASIGLGYQFIDEAHLALSAEAGVAYLNSNFYEADDISEVAMRAAINVMWKPFDGVTFTDQFVIFPFREGGEFLVRNEASVTVGLGAWLGGNWALKFSNVIDYDSNPADDRRRTDVLWLLTLQYTFG